MNFVSTVGDNARVSSTVFFSPESQTDIIYFLSTGSSSNSMNEALASLSNKQFRPKWVTEGEIDDIVRRERKPVVVMDVFEGPVFEKINSYKSIRILSPFAIIQCNPRNISFIPLRRYPVQNFCLKDCIVSFSNLKVDDVLKLKELVQAMGGSFSFHLRKKVNYMVTNSWSTKKTLMARCEGGRIQVMSDQWIHKCWELASRGVNANDPQLQKYRLPVFSGMRLCSSGVSKL